MSGSRGLWDLMNLPLTGYIGDTDAQGHLNLLWIKQQHLN